MFGLGWQEVVLILAILLFVFGPTKLPQIARELGKAWREFSKASSSIMEAASPPTTSTSEEIEESKAIVDMARNLDIDTKGKTIKQITEEITMRIENKEKEE